MTDPIGSIARQIAGLAGDIARLTKTVPSYQRGVVANVSPPTVIMDRDVTATPRPVADVLVPGLAVGQRVEVRVIGSRRVITSIHPIDLGDTGWRPLELASDVVPYNEGQRPRSLIRNGWVTIMGAVSPANTAAANALTGAGGNGIAILDLDANGIPVEPTPGLLLSSVHQGSSLDHWSTQYSEPMVRANRYSGTATTGTWMPFTLTYPIAVERALP